MFFPDKARAHAEVRRVLRPGGVYLFNVWDQIGENEFADVTSQALATLFPQSPPRFMARTPHGYFEHAVIAADLKKGGFATTPRIETVALRSRAESARIPAVAYCQGTLLRSEIEAVDRTRLGEATDVAMRALTQRFGPGSVEGKLQAHVITIER
jgi:SAM-dependent methyltransferase